MISKASLSVCAMLLMAVGGCALVDSVARSAGVSQRDAALLGGAAEAASIKLTPIGLEEELEYGGAIAVMIVDAYGGLDHDPALNAYVNAVGNTVALYSPRADLRYYFGVLNSDDIQAMAAPGGYVFITRGLIKALDDEAQLAGVLAHEVAHVCNKDTLKIIQNLKAQKAATDAAADAWKGAGAFSGVIDGVLEDYLTKGLPKKVEFAADIDGATIARAAGYDAHALDEALQHIEAAGGHGEQHASFNDTHPEFEDRFVRLRKHLATLPTGGQRLPDRFLTQTASIRN